MNRVRPPTRRPVDYRVFQGVLVITAAPDRSKAGLILSYHDFRGTKLAVTYHPAFLLRDPRQKKETWKDLQMVMKELGLALPAKPQE